MSKSTHENEFVTDTIGLVLRLEGRKLGAKAKGIFESVESGQAVLYVPGVVFFEILYLSEKQRITVSLGEVTNYLKKYPDCKESPLTLGVVKAAAEIHDIPELHDRLIAGTAKSLNLSLITSDQIIRASRFVQTVW